jgi:hypothetical protein
VNNLAAKVQLLSRQVAELDAKTGAAKAPAARRTAAKKATGKAARKTTRKKAIRRKTAGKAGSVAAKPAGGAG